MKRLVWNNRMTPKALAPLIVTCPVCKASLDPYREPYALIKPSYDMVHAQCAAKEVLE